MAVVSQFMGRLTPADRPRLAPLPRIAPAAKCVPTSEEEQAVSIATAGGAGGRREVKLDGKPVAIE